jgi:hypothetical protein
MYDIIFISYNEPEADANFNSLKDRFPLVKRVNGIKGIHQAHIAAAKKSFTKMMWVVDADAVVLNSFKFDYLVPEWETDVVHVWHSINPINSLSYGYGGIKLLPRSLTARMNVNNPDMTMSISKKFKVMKEVSNITAFNTDEFTTWRSAFRECAKLASIKDSEATERLDTWCNVSNGHYGIYAIEGAVAGRKYGEKNAGNIPALSKINDFKWLADQFESHRKNISNNLSTG